jgi:hypothetical protein
MEIVTITAKNKVDVDKIMNFINETKLQVVVKRKKSKTTAKTLLTGSQLETIKGIKQGLSELKLIKEGKIKAYSMEEGLKILNDEQ